MPKIASGLETGVVVSTPPQVTKEQAQEPAKPARKRVARKKAEAKK